MGKTKKKTRRKKRSKSGKGAAFERKLCRTLSRWWSGGERDDIFWRTSQSGGRATTRAKSGRATYGQSGDVAAIDPIGTPLIAQVSIEAKYGYKNCGTPFDWVSGVGDISKHSWTRWIEQAVRAKEQTGAKFWWLIVRQHKRRAVVVYPYAFHVRFKLELCFVPHVIINGIEIDGESKTYRRLVAVPFEEFLEALKPTSIKRFNLETWT